ncbi:copper resistance protein B [Qipengyuania qiaonensis]|uniref:Copper resistance protein B n=1 Tax=Qipengyuania qiaonensis TaxID=2867240 RepID=A0ABS7J1P9_9SPHN|nr:copper resistance protein B [Qipengyuania qiaonensis]MBX7481250.1 copper resistance protein B [Qipengyuania qiaonensis]
MRVFVAALLASTATPAIAQDHSGHAVSAAPPPAQSECEMEAARHRAMGHPVPEGSCVPEASTSDEKPADAGTDHGGVDHSHMDHGAVGTRPIADGPAPAAAGAGPPRAADAIWGADAMRASREALRIENGGMSYFWFQGDRAEYRAREAGDGYLWDVQGYYGDDIDKFWFKSEGEGAFGEKPESAELQGLWSHAIGPWWDLQAGIRQDLVGPGRTHAVIGVQGLAPYLFEVDAAAFLSTKGDLTARVEAELDERVTQRLILQPRAEVNLSARDVPELGVGAGVDTVELGLRLRYEIAREFAPYIGVEQEWKLGRSADYARLAGDDPSVTNYVIGLRFWF